MTKAQKAERQEAIDQLREWIKPGDTIYTILRQVSRSGMSRQISVVLPTFSGPAIESVAPGGKPADYVRMDAIKIDFLHPNYLVAKAIGARLNRGGCNDAIVMGGCGMDMGFALVYELAHVLYGKGYQCLGKGKCPSSYHNNHRDTIQCEGIDGERCWWSREGKGWVVEEGNHVQRQARDQGQAYIDAVEADTHCHERKMLHAVKLCPTCKGKGRVPNPEGPERFDLVHTDGYALRHKWL